MCVCVCGCLKGLGVSWGFQMVPGLTPDPLHHPALCPLLLLPRHHSTVHYDIYNREKHGMVRAQQAPCSNDRGPSARSTPERPEVTYVLSEGCHYSGNIFSLSMTLTITFTMENKHLDIKEGRIQDLVTTTFIFHLGTVSKRSEKYIIYFFFVKMTLHCNKLYFRL